MAHASLTIPGAVKLVSVVPSKRVCGRLARCKAMSEGIGDLNPDPLRNVLVTTESFLSLPSFLNSLDAIQKLLLF